MLSSNSFSSARSIKQLLPILCKCGYDHIHTIIHCGNETSNACILFLRVILQASVIRCCVSQELGSVLFSTAWFDINTFGHCGAPLMGMYAQLRSAPEMNLDVADRLQLRGLSSESEIKDGVEESQSSVESQPILLCSCCQGRGVIWIRGVPFSDSYAVNENQWVNTGLYGLWRDDGGMEILDV